MNSCYTYTKKNATLLSFMVLVMMMVATCNSTTPATTPVSITYLLDCKEGWKSDTGAIYLSTVVPRPFALHAGFLAIAETKRTDVIPTSILDYNMYPPIAEWRRVQCDVRLEHSFGFIGKQMLTASVYFTSSTNLRLDFGDNRISQGDSIRIKGGVLSGQLPTVLL